MNISVSSVLSVVTFFSSAVPVGRNVTSSCPASAARHLLAIVK
jgi:hypothetical protein